MGRPRKDGHTRNNRLGINLKVLKKEIKMIPFDIKKEMRLLDLLFNEKVASRTQVEKDVLLELIEKARDMINLHQNKLDRFQKFYSQIRSGNGSDNGLLTPEEMDNLQKASTRAYGRRREEMLKEPLRTGTHG